MVVQVVQVGGQLVSDFVQILATVAHSHGAAGVVEESLVMLETQLEGDGQKLNLDNY